MVRSPSSITGTGACPSQGLVDRSLRLGLDEIRDGSLTPVELVATLQRAGNRRQGLIAERDIPGEASWGPGATGTARWSGVRLAELLELAGVASGARHVAFVGADRSEESEPPQCFGGSIPLSKAASGETMLAFAMNGQPLPTVHGGPLRLVVPGYIGARSVKWLQRIELRRDPWDGYFQEVVYRLLTPDQSPGPGVGVALGEAGLNADVLDPADRATVAAGEVPLSGYAFAGGARGIVRVEFSGDGGQTWRQAELLEDQGRWAWRLWPRPGSETPSGRISSDPVRCRLRRSSCTRTHAAGLIPKETR